MSSIIPTEPINYSEASAVSLLTDFIRETADADDLARLMSLVIEDGITTVTNDNGTTSEPFQDGHSLNGIWRIVLADEEGEDGETLYWSNDDGWVNKESATVFTIEERNTYDHLPMDGKWEHEPKGTR